MWPHSLQRSANRRVRTERGTCEKTPGTPTTRTAVRIGARQQNQKSGYLLVTIEAGADFDAAFNEAGKRFIFDER